MTVSYSREKKGAVMDYSTFLQLFIDAVSVQSLVYCLLLSSFLHIAATSKDKKIQEVKKS